jgi:hypothetical protein
MLLKKKPIIKTIATVVILGTFTVVVSKKLFPLYSMPQDDFLQKYMNSLIPLKNLDATMTAIKFVGTEGMNEKLHAICLNSIILYSVFSILISGAFRLFPLKNITSFLLGIFIPSLVLGMNIYLYLNCLTDDYNFFDTSAFIFIIIGSAIGTLCTSIISKVIIKKKKKLEE